MRWDIICHKEIDSTNEEARRLSVQGQPEGLVICADSQSAGRGRRGRAWDSPCAENLYFSILLRPAFPAAQAPMLTLVMAYSVTRVIREKLGLPAFIKWPNDVGIDGRKVCGILTEMHLDGTRIADVIIGVGINVNQTDFRADIAHMATSLALQAKEPVDRQWLLQEILKDFQVQYETFAKKGDLSFLQEAYNGLLANREQMVSVMEPGQEYRGIALGVNERGELLVRRENGEVETVYAGEVSVRGIYGYV